jgi:hypothetical protein
MKSGDLCLFERIGGTFAFDSARRIEYSRYGKEYVGPWRFGVFSQNEE